MNRKPRPIELLRMFAAGWDFEALDAWLGLPHGDAERKVREAWLRQEKHRRRRR